MNSVTRAGTIWTAILAAVTSFGSYGFACVFPFSALAVLASITLPRRSGLLLMISVWVVNQAVGYGLHGYPTDANTIGWGVAIGAASIAAYYVARAIVSERTPLLSVQSFLGLAGAFLSYEALLFAYAQFAGGLETFSADIVSKLALSDALWFCGLCILRLALAKLAPARFGTTAISAAN
jgi:hypothetical protein